MLKSKSLSDVIYKYSPIEPDTQYIYFYYILFKNKVAIYEFDTLFGMLSYILQSNRKSDYDREMQMLIEIYQGGNKNEV